MNITLQTIMLAIGINVLMFVPAYIYKTDKLTDISYAVTFIVLAVFGYVSSTQTMAHTILFVMILLWAIRLGSFLFVRINRAGHDKRFDKMRNKPLSFLQFWLLQGSSVFIILLSSVKLWEYDQTKTGLVSIFGVVIFLVGLVLEATADQQKFSFKNNAANNDKWIDSGVWKVSRHPNYLGEMMVWVGVYLFVLPSLTGNNVLFGLISPLYIISLLSFVSGIPLLEKSADSKWGELPKYQAYKKNTPVLLPRIFK